MTAPKPSAIESVYEAALALIAKCSDDLSARTNAQNALTHGAALRSQQEPEGKITAAMLKAFHIANGDTLPCSGDMVKDADAWATHLLTRALAAAPGKEG